MPMNQILSSLSGSAASLEADRTHFLARQPIFNGREKVIGYELLHRSGTENFFAHEDGDQASSDVMSNSLLLFGLTRLVGNKKAFINVPRKTLLEGSYSVLPRERTVIEVLETVRPDEEVIEAFKKLERDGFTLALDDFAGPVGGPFTALADIIKVDFRLTTGDRRPAWRHWRAVTSTGPRRSCAARRWPPRRRCRSLESGRRRCQHPMR